MATRAMTIDRNISPSGEAILVSWAGLLNGDDGTPMRLSEFSEKTLQLIGTFGAGGSGTLQGSNDGVNWATMNTKQGAAIALTAATALGSPQDKPLFVRPKITGGDGTTSLTALLCAHRTDINPVGA